MIGHENKNTLYACAGLVVLLSGCANMSEPVSLGRSYTEPQSGDTAALRVSTNGTVRLIPDRDCNDWAAPGSGVVVSTEHYVGLNPTLNGKTLGGVAGSAPAGMASAEVKAAVGKSLTVVFSNEIGDGDMRYICEPFSITFVPQAGQQYQVIGQQRGDCYISVQSLIDPDLRVPTRRAENCR